MQINMTHQQAEALLEWDRFGPDWAAIRVRHEYWDHVFHSDVYSVRLTGKPGVVPQSERLANVTLDWKEPTKTWHLVPSKYLDQIPKEWLKGRRFLPTRAELLEFVFGAR